MKTKLKIFAFLVVIGFGTLILFLHIDWGFYAECLEEGLFPSLSDGVRCSRLFEIQIPEAFAEPFVSDDNLVDNLKQNQLPIGQGIYMNFTVFLVLLGGGIGGIIFAVKRKRK